MLILYNAKIYTLSEPSKASAIAVDRGKIIALGDDDQILTQFGQGARKFDLQQYPVIPGLIDAHVHLEHYALSLQKIDCEVSSLAECIRRVAARVRQTPHDDFAGMLNTGFRLTWGREATDEEMKRALAFTQTVHEDGTITIESDQLIDFCQVLLNSNEFTYID